MVRPDAGAVADSVDVSDPVRKCQPSVVSAIGNRGCLASNEAAQSLYVRHGFKEVERTDISGNEEGAPDIQYAWDPD